MVSKSAVTLAAFVNNETGAIRIHAAGCSHTLRETRRHGLPITFTTESTLGMVREIKRNGIRSNDLYFLGCVGVPESFAILSPNGDKVSTASSRKAASKATGRIKRQARQEIADALNGMSVFARQMLEAQK